MFSSIWIALVSLIALVFAVAWWRARSAQAKPISDPNPKIPDDTNTPSASLAEQLQEAQKHLQEAHQQLISQERMASMGLLSAGIAHEIKNPLNFINNFSDITVELLEELKKELSKESANIPADTQKSIYDIIDDVINNNKKISEHGRRAESIIKNMLIQSRSAEVEKTPIDINALLDEYLSLAYHGMRAQNNKLNAKIEKNLKPTLPKVTASAQSIGRVFLNVLNNGLYAANEKNEKEKNFMPTIFIATEENNDFIIIKIKDNGNGISESLRKKIFEPFFTTKPVGKGTGLGLPLCHDIVVKEHKGQIDVISKPGEFTEFIIMLPKDKNF